MIKLAIAFRDNGVVRSLAVSVDWFRLDEDGTLYYGHNIQHPDTRTYWAGGMVPGVLVFTAR